VDIEDIRRICKGLPAVTEDVKWGNDLCFSVGGKMFSVAGLTNPVSLSFKVSEEEFEELSVTPGFKPAPYLARYKWVWMENAGSIPSAQLKQYLTNSYTLIRSKLPRKVLKEIGLS
jgi:predicted DNA-binding protein (MmcQ/YjbR family)